MDLLAAARAFDMCTRKRGHMYSSLSHVQHPSHMITTSKPTLHIVSHAPYPNSHNKKHPPKKKPTKNLHSILSPPRPQKNNYQRIPCIVIDPSLPIGQKRIHPPPRTWCLVSKSVQCRQWRPHPCIPPKKAYQRPLDSYLSPPLTKSWPWKKSARGKVTFLLRASAPMRLCLFPFSFSRLPQPYHLCTELRYRR